MPQEFGIEFKNLFINKHENMITFIGLDGMQINSQKLMSTNFDSLKENLKSILIKFNHSHIQF